MSDVTRILSAIEQGEPHAAEQLLPLVYAELRRLAAEKMAREKPGQTLQATALVHEAYCVWSATSLRRKQGNGGPIAAISSRPRRRPCVASWWRTRAARRAASTAAA
jgi:hypothetical protein